MKYKYNAVQKKILKIQILQKKIKNLIQGLEPKLPK